MSLQDKVCIITGGGSGIGRGAAITMAQNGARVALVGRTAEKVEAVKDEIVTASGTALAFALDVADYDAVQKMAKVVLDTFGRIDVLVNNAGHSSQHRRLLTITPEEIRSVIDSNLIGTIFCTQAVVSRHARGELDFGQNERVLGQKTRERENGTEKGTGHCFAPRLRGWGLD